MRTEMVAEWKALQLRQACISGLLSLIFGWHSLIMIVFALLLSTDSGSHFGVPCDGYTISVAKAVPRRSTDQFLPGLMSDSAQNSTGEAGLRKSLSPSHMLLVRINREIV